MIDKAKEFTTTVKLINKRLNFSGMVDGNEPVSIDYIAPLGDNLGYTSLELFLLSLSSCMGSSVLTFLRRMGRHVESCEISSRGIRRQEHPTGFSNVFLEIFIQSPDVMQEDMLKVIKLSEETYCPVLSMVKGNVETSITFTIKP